MALAIPLLALIGLMLMQLLEETLLPPPPRSSGSRDQSGDAAPDVKAAHGHHRRPAHRVHRVAIPRAHPGRRVARRLAHGAQATHGAHARVEAAAPVRLEPAPVTPADQQVKESDGFARP
ncbi:hypothetical protein [Nonomuraea aridisoli]|uniref:Uncharacterized protein n=1 Tax=Nonomuraea aridisoli TaxID=2070368 RepID=A0A2W2D6L3_9ACTN|nr:hypothetical protein [Nonomuraea aridisoli]PZG06553.1 hypothetical protein C1J01_42300 [Nonomuraea aridisoli]